MTSTAAANEQEIVTRALVGFEAYFGRRVGVRGGDLARDLAQEAVIGLLRSVRAGGIENEEALRHAIGQRTWFAYLRREYRWKKVWDPTPVEAAGETVIAAAPAGHLRVGDPADRLRFQVLEFFEAVDAKCLGLARQYFGGLDWQEAARRAGIGYSAVRKQWSRCLASLRTAVAKDEDLGDSLWAFWEGSS